MNESKTHQNSSYIINKLTFLQKCLSNGAPTAECNVSNCVFLLFCFIFNAFWLFSLPLSLSLIRCVLRVIFFYDVRMVWKAFYIYCCFFSSHWKWHRVFTAASGDFYSQLSSLCVFTTFKYETQSVVLFILRWICMKLMAIQNYQLVIKLAPFIRFIWILQRTRAGERVHSLT